MTDKGKAISVLSVNTFSFVVCFSCWVLYGVLMAFLVDNGLFHFDAGQIGWLLGVPILTGSVTRLPAGVLTDRYGGRIVFAVIMLLSAVAMYCVSFCNSFEHFLLAGLGFGLSGASFAVGIAYTSLWFPREKQGTALGIFGAGNAGASLTSMGAPHLLNYCTNNLQNLEGWRTVPKIYAVLLVVTTVIFWFLTFPKKVDKKGLSIAMQLAPLKQPRVWRFGLYYFFVFGGFVALSQWLISYYLNVYTMSLATAGLMAAIFSLPSGVIRAIGGWLSDKYGARSIMYWVLGSCLFASLALCVPRMDIETPGQGVMCTKKGTVTRVTSTEIAVGEKVYPIKKKEEGNMLTILNENKDLIIWPTSVFWQEPIVKEGDQVAKKQVLARGITHIFFQANVWIFTAFVLILGIMTGIGKAAVYRHIPDYFPNDVGVVGGIVGVIGGLGGFVGPIIFGYMLQVTGIWTTCWMSFALLSLACLIWMHATINKMMRKQAPHLVDHIETAISAGH
ncbi:MAG: MFS transporter [Candidatus Obscuribacter sp.]|nr:MFS transporter [Candidatus Obscuribacter sp.]